MIIEKIEENQRKYSIVYADPPWQKKKGGLRKSRPNQTRDLDYKTLDNDKIKNIISKIKVEEKHNFFVWTIDEFLFDCENIMKELGYSLHARLIWDKENGVAPAFTVRYSHEYLLWFYKKGNMLKPCENMRGKQTTVFREKSIKHSKKPEIAYKMIEKMFPNTSKIELFARNERENWDSFGNEILMKEDNEEE